MILLVNPWIDDFTAYDLWSKPWGLTRLYSWLKANGEDVMLADFLYQHYFKDRKAPPAKADGRGHYEKREIPHPPQYRPLNIHRRFYRFGLSEEAAASLLTGVVRPELIMVTSGMTYWYRGLAGTIKFLRALFPGVPIVAGGIYATLCAEHARHAGGADLVFSGASLKDIALIVEQYTGRTMRAGMNVLSPPDLSAYPYLPYAPIKLNSGCPYDCPYCASRVLEPSFKAGPPSGLNEYFDSCVDRGIRDFAFYDDALLVDRERVLLPFLRRAAEKKEEFRFHTPNALHVNLFDTECAETMRAAGNWSLRFGFETSSSRLETKTDGLQLRRINEIFERLGFEKECVRIYLLAGLPRQKASEVADSIAFVKDLGLRPVPNEYSPVPGSSLFGEADRSSAYDLKGEPLYHNKTIVPCGWEGLTYDDMQDLKSLARL